MNNYLEPSTTELYLQKIQDRQNQSLSTLMQSGDKYVYWKSAESAVNSLAYGKNFGYNMFSTFRINPLLDLGTEITGINSKLGKLASKISFNNRNLTDGLNLFGKVGIRYVTPEAIKNNPLDSHLMHGLNFTISNNDLNLKQIIKNQMLKYDLTSKMANKIFKNGHTLSSPTLSQEVFHSVINSPITKGLGKATSKAMAGLNSLMIYEMAIEFAEMYNDHIINNNIKKSLDYKKDSLKPLNQDLLNEKTQYNISLNNENEEELNFLLRKNYDIGRYF